MAIKRENGSGSFRSKGNSLEYRVLFNGVTKSFSGKTETECKRKYREWVRENTQRELIGDKLAEPSTTLLIDYINDWFKINKFGKVKDSTYDRTENVIRHNIEPYDVAGMRLCDLDGETLQNFINDISLLYSRSTVKKVYDVIKPSLKEAHHKHLINDDIVYNLFVPNEDFFAAHPTKEIEIYTDEEIDILSRVAYELYFVDSRKYRYAPVYLLILNTGMRLGEVLALEWSKVNLENKKIYIDKTLSYVQNRNRFETDHQKVCVITSPKTKAGKRFIPLNDAALKALQELKHRQESQNINSKYVLCNLDGSYMQGRSVQDVFKDICTDNEIISKGIHALRHTFATKLIHNHIDIGIISKLLGHSSVKITYDTYIHFIEEDIVDAVEAVNF